MGSHHCGHLIHAFAYSCEQAKFDGFDDKKYLLGMKLDSPPEQINLVLCSASPYDILNKASAVRFQACEPALLQNILTFFERLEEASHNILEVVDWLLVGKSTIKG